MSSWNASSMRYFLTPSSFWRHCCTGFSIFECLPPDLPSCPRGQHFEIEIACLAQESTWFVLLPLCHLGLQRVRLEIPQFDVPVALKPHRAALPRGCQRSSVSEIVWRDRALDVSRASHFEDRATSETVHPSGPCTSSWALHLAVGRITCQLWGLASPQKCHLSHVHLACEQCKNLVHFRWLSIARGAERSYPRLISTANTY